jgi:hypothetical protein
MPRFQISPVTCELIDDIFGLLVGKIDYTGRSIVREDEFGEYRPGVLFGAQAVFRHRSGATGAAFLAGAVADQFVGF